MNNQVLLFDKKQFKGVKMFSDSTAEEEILKGVEVELLQHTPSGPAHERILSEICGAHFFFKTLRAGKSSIVYYIRPFDHSLVNGGMMYTSAGSLISAIISRGLLLKNVRTIVGRH